MKRGEVRWVNFDPPVGGESRKTRPAIIISNDAANKHLNRVHVVSLTTQVGRVYPSEALITFAGQEGKALADQLTTVSKLRLENRAGNRTGLDSLQFFDFALAMPSKQLAQLFLRSFHFQVA